MVFFTSIIIIVILYYLQADGLIYAVIIALATEFINIFLTHTLTKSVEGRLKGQHRKAIEGYVRRIKANKLTIKELEKIQEDATSKIFKANERIRELEEQLKGYEKAVPQAPPPPLIPEKEPPPQDIKDNTFRDDLPEGSKKRPPRR